MASNMEIRVQSLEEQMEQLQRLMENIVNNTQIQQLNATHQSNVDGLDTRLSTVEADIEDLKNYHLP